jgi:PEP-CTERM motif
MAAHVDSWIEIIRRSWQRAPPSEKVVVGGKFRMSTRRILIPLLALVLLAVPATAGPIVYVLTGSVQFGDMDLATGAVSPIGPIPETIQYLAPAPDGSLLTMVFNGDLAKIDPGTGALSVIGPTGFSDCTTPTSPCGPHSQLSLGSNGGTIFATDFANDLYTINPSTGQGTLVGPTGIPALPSIPLSTNPDGSFNFYDENLFGVGGKLYANFDVGSFNPATSVITTVIPAALYQINPSTGLATMIAATDLGLVTIVNVNGTVYGFKGSTNQVVTLDVTNGHTSIVSDIDPAAGLIGGAAPVPEPGSILLTALGLIAVGSYGRRRRRSGAALDGLRGMVTGVATSKVTVTLPDSQIEEIRALMNPDKPPVSLHS